MKNKEFVTEWLIRAKSNLERAKLGKIPDPDVLYSEDFGYGGRLTILPPCNTIVSIVKLI